MYTKNKFESLKTNQLLKYVQQETVSLSDTKIKKKSRTKVIIKRTEDLMMAREELVGRLSKMDRNSTDFFPVSSMIEYSGTKGVVLNNDDGQIYIKLEGEDFLLKVDPSKIKLINIRSIY